MNLLASSRAAAPAALALLPTLLLALPAAHADTLVDNLSQPYNATTTVTSVLWSAQSFVTGSDAVRLLSIEIPIGESLGGPSIFAELHADAGPMQVGAMLTSFVLPEVSAGALEIELLPTMPTRELDLAPDTIYWVVLGVVGAGSFGWSYAQGNASSGPGSLANYSYSSDGGSSWLTFGNDDPYHIRVNVSPIPEPGSAALLFSGLLAIGSLYRRRTPY